MMKKIKKIRKIVLFFLAFILSTYLGATSLNFKGIVARHPEPIFRKNVAVAAAPELTNLEKWSDAATWGGSVPKTNASVTIPKGKNVLLDVDSLNLKDLTIEGALVFGDRNIDLTTNKILIKGGLLEIGTEQKPYKRKAKITLNDPRTIQQSDASGIKYISTTEGGRLELHGRSRGKKSWTQLEETAKKGSTSFRVVNEKVRWNPGDKIVIASTSVNPYEAEKLTVTSVVGQTVSFTPALQYDHYGEQHTYSGKTIDMRAEVGLLSRNILIQGDEASLDNEIGGHLIFMASSKVKIEGVEFVRMGQMRNTARYPIHWHFAGDGSGQYAKKNSIHDSFNRAIVTHGTDNVLVADNVAYDIFSHGYVPAEDGMETGNIYRKNLGILNKGLTGDQFAFGRLRSGGDFESKQEEHRAGMFWLTNLNNTVYGNHAAGSWYGIGYLFTKPDYKRWVAMSKEGLNKPYKNLCKFQNNVAHSTFRDKSDNLGFYGSATAGWGLFFRPLAVGKAPGVKCVVSGYSAYKTQLGGAWMEEGIVLKNTIVTDSDTGIFIADNAVVDDAVIVGQTPNKTGETATITVTTRKKSQPTADIDLDFSRPIHSHGGIFNIPQINALTDGAKVKNVKFHDLPAGIYLNDLNKVQDGKFSVEKIKCINTPYCLTFDLEVKDGGVLDKDGSISGKPRTIIQATDEYKPKEPLLPLKGDKGFEWLDKSEIPNVSGTSDTYSTPETSEPYETNGTYD